MHEQQMYNLIAVFECVMHEVKTHLKGAHIFTFFQVNMEWQHWLDQLSADNLGKAKAWCW